MKKQDPFSGIPAVPNSLAGQWLAFNHMANHYRKLLNVKPRVDTAAPRIASNNNILQIQNQLSHLTSKGTQSGTLGTNTKLKKNAKNVKKQTVSTIKQETTSNNRPTANQAQYSDFADSPESSPRTPRNLVKKRLARKSIDNDSNNHVYSEDYEVLFGPSSFKSSTDALASDYDSQPEVPGVEVETIGVAEKIQVFLKQLHEHNNFVQKKAPSPSCARKSYGTPALVQSNQPKPPSLTKGPLTKSKLPAEPRLSRHSKCFLPCPSNENSPKKVVKKPPAPISGMNSRVSLSEAINKAKVAKALESRARSTTITNIRRDAEGESRRKAAMVKGNKSRYLSGGSAGSVGTIRGSDELTAEDLLELPLSPKKVPISQESPNSIKHFTNSSKQRNKSGILRTSSAGYCSQSLSGKATSLSSLGVINNKDSSRDSAYGFSSGESRITTRESTPETMHENPYHNHNNTKSKGRKSLDKNNNNVKYKSALSTVASSVILDTMPDNLGDHIPKEKRQSSEKEVPGDKYLNFLTDITEDIVNRGIYTNKGLKVLFKAHQENHKGLDPVKMEEMLEKLRMDLGIPKDDTLNKLEFGYGSVLYTTDSYYYQKGHPPIPEKVPSSDSKRKDSSRKCRLGFLNARQSSHESNTSSELLRNGSDGDNQSSSSNSGTSLSDSELRLTLKEAGVDSETALEIVQIMNHQGLSNDDSDQSRSPRLSKSSRHNKCPLENRRRQSIRSDSPPSRCSTGSS